MTACGLEILIRLMQELGIARVTPISTGLRMGLSCDLRIGVTKRDCRKQSMHEFLRRFHSGKLRQHWPVENFALMFNQLLAMQK
jgi:hypothetical protein